MFVKHRKCWTIYIVSSARYVDIENKDSSYWRFHFWVFLLYFSIWFTGRTVQMAGLAQSDEERFHHTQNEIHTHTHTHRDTHAGTHTHRDTHAGTYTHTHRDTHAGTYTRTHTQLDTEISIYTLLYFNSKRKFLNGGRGRKYLQMVRIQIANKIKWFQIDTSNI